MPAEKCALTTYEHLQFRVAPGFSTFGYLGYQALFWPDLYLAAAEEGVAPPAPFDLVELNQGDLLPRTYTCEDRTNEHRV